MSLIKYIQRNHRTLSERKETTFFNSITVFIKDPLPENVSLRRVLRRVEQIIPRHLVYNIDVVYIGHFKLFVDREINAMYKDGGLYVSNDQDDEEDMIDDIVHEIAHAVEEKYWAEIYGDDEVEREFLAKRKILYQTLKSHDYPVNYEQFMNSEYNESFDELLYKKVGYEKLEFFTMNLFPSNYSATSLREYFGIGFEYFYLQNRGELSTISPVLFQKLERINDEEE